MTIFQSDNTRFKSNRTISAASGFSLVELIMSLTLSLLILGVGVTMFSGALGSRDRETSRTDALTSAQAALNIMSREIGNAGFGLTDNGIVISDSDANRMHFRANIENTGSNGTSTAQPGEDVAFYYDSVSQSVVRFDRVSGTSGIINRVSHVDFAYYDYTVDPVTGAVTVTPAPGLTAPSINTARVTVTLTVFLADARGEPSAQSEKVKSDVTLRNSTYMRGLY